LATISVASLIDNYTDSEGREKIEKDMAAKASAAPKTCALRIKIRIVAINSTVPIV